MRFSLMQRRQPSETLLSNRHRRRALVEELEPRNLLTTAYYNPIQLAAAYGFPTSSTAPYPGAGETIAIVDAYNDPTITNDANTFDANVNAENFDGQWTPPGAAVPAFGQPGVGQLTIVNQTGGTIKNQTSTRGTTPAYNSSWDVEIALDVEWSHAMAPGANILLVEANSDSISDLMTAVKYAAGHAQVVSMSWGSSEFSGETADDATFAAFAGTGVTFVASSGDSGVVSWPAVSPDVVGVGGTILNLTSLAPGGAYSGETAWSDSGGGVSKYEPAQTYQAAVGTSNGASSAHRNSPDVAYDSGSSSSPISPYDVIYDAGGWYSVYGTSAGAPQWSALIAITDQGLASATNPNTNEPYAPLDFTQTLPGLYKLPSTDFNDITSGGPAGHKAGTGYDLATGLGSPIATNPSGTGVIADLITYAEGNPDSSTAFPSVAPGGSGKPGKPNDDGGNILAFAGIRTPINNGPASLQANVLAFNPVQKLTAPPLEIVPTATTVNIVDGMVSGAPSVLSNTVNSAGGVVPGSPDGSVNDVGTMSPSSPTAGASVGNAPEVWSGWSSALWTSVSEWGSSTNFDATGSPMFSTLHANHVSNAGREQDSDPGAAAFAALALMAWTASEHTKAEAKKTGGAVLRRKKSS